MAGQVIAVKVTLRLLCALIDIAQDDNVFL